MGFLFGHQGGIAMVPEYRELISQLKASDRYFDSLFSKHKELDQTVKNMEVQIEPDNHDEIQGLKNGHFALSDQVKFAAEKQPPRFESSGPAKTIDEEGIDLLIGSP
jgi:uncharacterized protein YdcH (DUF465 family)